MAQGQICQILEPDQGIFLRLCGRIFWVGCGPRNSRFDFSDNPVAIRIGNRIEKLLKGFFIHYCDNKTRKSLAEVCAVQTRAIESRF